MIRGLIALEDTAGLVLLYRRRRGAGPSTQTAHSVLEAVILGGWIAYYAPPASR
ncbi:hypothetical protein HBI71_218210 [Parastagonospora nodorum]|nr:hypothetical protein HBI71_218210 [Parastagonospora nodorum]